MSSGRWIPLIFIGAADAVTRQRAVVMGCVAYLEEPVSSDVLIAAIRRLSTSSEGEEVH